MSIFDRRESEVRSYSRRWPAVFGRAAGSWLYGVDETPYLDFFAGAGTLNYGHNDPVLKRALISYLEQDGVTHALDMFTAAKANLLETLEEKILAPRGLDYKVVFPGPAGANAVEAALKLARKATGRKWVAYFRNAFHGMTLGALSVNGNPAVRLSAGTSLAHCLELPYEQQLTGTNGFEDMLADSAGGLAGTAAVIVETVQGEGGINVARIPWLRELSAVCRRHGIVLIVDDIQMGCGRVGPFFSFEDAGIEPDIVCLSKSISGYGLPMALTLIRPELDVWKPGEHNGTFRGFSLAFVTGAEALRAYWSDEELVKSTRTKGERVAVGLEQIRASYPETGLTIRGRGLAWGLQTGDGDTADQISAAAFERGLLVETCGRDGEVVKLLPPLSVTGGDIDRALEILDASVKSALAGRT
ncbi:diaminobutyrate--2-oxoglutarate transaminase [Micromonospora echinospora]|uniref:Diaminobutyrate--2-oxoglutarate transaminase n=1 Tax=Micromonospora echinospora TaxID=1877 RepID=A0A1C5A4X6_MICEC|nr:diaminobutyrate--2-oxoglutarate transaminase [Micromonospora echinospora]OZV75355.1 diaminobutyrate--2-oxoglutarate transaminase [Micromonospora echinospora]SCF40265.1 diaminobutyrate aminotransferase apoenzyme [Micromonospora echinospora]